MPKPAKEMQLILSNWPQSVVEWNCVEARNDVDNTVVKSRELLQTAAVYAKQI